MILILETIRDNFYRIWKSFVANPEITEQILFQVGVEPFSQITFIWNRIVTCFMRFWFDDWYLREWNAIFFIFWKIVNNKSLRKYFQIFSYSNFISIFNQKICGKILLFVLQWGGKTMEKKNKLSFPLIFGFSDNSIIDWFRKWLRKLIFLCGKCSEFCEIQLYTRTDKSCLHIQIKSPDLHSAFPSTSSKNGGKNLEKNKQKTFSLSFLLCAAFNKLDFNKLDLERYLTGLQFWN